MNPSLLSRKPSFLSRRHSSIEILEDRIALNASPLAIAKALDLPAGTAVIYTGDASAVATFTFGTTGGFVGFPSGADNDFFVLSSGIASAVTGANSSGSQGTDLGASGVAGDTGTVKFSLNVPVSSMVQKFKFDFVFLSEEFPEYVGSSFNDIFTGSVNGQNVAKDQFGNVISVNNAFFSGESAAGTFFDGRTSKLTASYTVPAGTAKLDIQLQLGDVGDGIYDSAVFIDNVRFETSQVIFVDFDGRTVVNHFGAGTSVNFPAFKASDVGSVATTASVIATVLSGLQSKYAAYDVVFTTTEPASGTYSTLVIGGDNNLAVDISAASPAFKAQFATATPTIRQVMNLGAGGTLFGMAAAVDVGNLVRKDLGVIFSDVFDNFYAGETAAKITDRLIVTSAHELGHNLGLRHIVNTQPQDILKQNSPRNSDAIFGTTQLTLAEAWSDGATTQNDDAYLKSILGSSSGSTTLVQSFVAVKNFFNGFFKQPVFDFTLQFDTAGSDSDAGPDFAPLVLNFDKFDGSQPISLPILPTDTKFSFHGSTTKGGPIDLFSGNPVGGNLAFDDTFFDLFNADGLVALNVPVATGELGTLASAGMFSFSDDVLAKKTAKFTDVDGDIVTVTLTGPGLVSVAQDDPDGNFKGALERITLNGTDAAKSSLSVSVAKFKGVIANPAKGIVGIAAGDGFVDIGEIIGVDAAGVKAIKAAKADLTGPGIAFAGAVGAIALHDVAGGADISTGAGPAKYQSSFTAHDIQDGSTLHFGTPLSAFTAARVGTGPIDAPAIAAVKIQGDTKAAIPGNLGADITVAGLLGKLTAFDILTGVDITGGGQPEQKTSIAAHDIADGVDIALTSSLSLLKAARIGDGSIHAASIVSLSVTGDVKALIAGDFESDIILAGEGLLAPFNNLLGSALIAGKVSGATISAENVNSFTAGVFSNSNLFAGFQPTSLGDPLAGGIFLAASAIKSFNIKSKIAGFENSNLGSAKIGAINIASLIVMNGSTRFGVISDTTIGSVSVTAPLFIFDQDGSNDQSLTDFHVVRV